MPPVAALRIVGLGDRLDHKPNELSGGQQQRASVTRALMMRPSLILADESTGTGLHSSVELMGFLQELNRELGITVVLVTHKPDIAAYTHRILRIREGLLSPDERVPQ